MPTIRVHSTFACTPERAFEALTDHAGFDRMHGLDVKIIERGPGHPNGVGTVRSMGGGGVHFEEEITVFEPPRAYEYRIRKGTIPVTHNGGRVEVVQDGAVCNVSWTTDITLPIPVIGNVLAYVLLPGIKISLKQLLAFSKTQAELPTAENL